MDKAWIDERKHQTKDVHDVSDVSSRHILVFLRGCTEHSLRVPGGACRAQHVECSARESVEDREQVSKPDDRERVRARWALRRTRVCGRHVTKRCAPSQSRQPCGRQLHPTIRANAEAKSA